MQAAEAAPSEVAAGEEEQDEGKGEEGDGRR